jgi:hypothetical protein
VVSAPSNKDSRTLVNAHITGSLDETGETGAARNERLKLEILFEQGSLEDARQRLESRRLEWWTGSPHHRERKKVSSSVVIKRERRAAQTPFEK